MIVGITGANGFIGRELVALLRDRHVEVLPIQRRASPSGDALVIGDLRAGTLPANLQERADVVVHLASAGSGGNSDWADPNDPLVADLVAGCRTAMHLAHALGAKHFIFVSSIKALAEDSGEGVLTEDAVPAPSTSYGLGKLLAEKHVRASAAGLGMRWTIVRPPMVHGTGYRGNFGLMVRLARSGMPLPLGGIGNLRSMVSVRNLCDALAAMAGNPAAAGQVFHIVDGPPISTSEMLRVLAEAQGRTVHLFSVPGPLARAAGRLPVVGGLVRRLTGNLAVAGNLVREELGWNPPLAGLRALRQSVRG